MVSRLALLVLGLLVVLRAGAASLAAETDRRELTVDEHLVLTLKLRNSDTRLRAEGENPNVDLSPLTHDFDLGVPRSRHDFRIDRPSARSTSELRVELFPRRPGRALIPAFTVDGLRTRPIPIHVLPASGDGPKAVFARPGPHAERRPYVHEATLVTLDFYHRVEIKDARLDGPLDIEPATAVDLAPLEARERHERIGDLDYTVTRMAWALSARQAGTIRVRLPAIWYETTTGRRERLPPSRITIEARALPEGRAQTLIVGRPTLSAQIEPTQATVGRPIDWRIALTAPTLPVHLPERLPLPALPAHIEVYAERPGDGKTQGDGDGGIVSRRVYPVTLVPTRAGTFSIPGLDLPYFDPRQGRIGLVHLPGRQIEVTAATPGSKSSGPSSPGPLGTGNEDGPTSDQGQEGDTPSMWPFVSLALLTLWLATLVALWRTRASRRRHSQRRTSSPSVPIPSGPQTPVDRLLTAMGTRTLEAGLRRWRTMFGPDERRERLVRKVQAARYGVAPDIGEQDLEALVDEIIAGLPEAPEQVQALPEPWQAAAYGKPPPPGT